MRVSLITGGGRGIGRAIALALSGPGTFVIVTGRTVADLDATASDLAGRGGQALVVPMDVTSDASVAEAMERIRAAVSHVDVLVNNAGVGGGEPIGASDIARWRRTIDTNLVGSYLVSREVVPLIPAGGRVINLSSVLGRFGVAGYTAYCSAKHGVIGFTRALALELAPNGITVNALCPGWVETAMAEQGMRRGAEATGSTFEEFRDRALSMVPIRRMIQPEEVAELVKFLTSPGASAITGQTYNICGGQTMD